MNNTDALVQDVRDMWSYKGVEIESQSGNKIRVRIPPYFQALNEFVTSLESLHNCDVDLECTINNNTACVILTIYIGQNGNDPTTEEHVVPRFSRLTCDQNHSRWSASSVAWLLALLLIFIFQVLIIASEWPKFRSMLGGAAKTA